MFQNLCRSCICRMPVSLSEWRVRIGTYVPRMSLVKTVAHGESNMNPSEKQEMGPKLTTDHQTSTNKTPSKPKKEDGSCGSSDEQKTTTTADQTKSMPLKESKRRKHRNRKGSCASGQSSGAFLSLRCFMKSGASPLLRFMLLVFTTILLVRSGDVEVNPGPNETIPTSVPDGTLHNIAKRISQDKMYDLGIKLGVDLSALRRYHATNTLGGTVNWSGTLHMLEDWRDNTTMQQQEELLRNALNATSLQAVAEKYLTEDPPPVEEISSVVPNVPVQHATAVTQNAHTATTDMHHAYEVPPITDTQLEQCREEIKAFYDINLCQIPTSPLDTDSLVELKCIFTNLVLLEENRSTNKKTHLAYKDLLDIKINNQKAKRIMVEGEAGVGKTTFCAKIALDWITREFYQGYALLAVIPLRDAKNRKTVGQVLKTYLSDDNSVTAEQLDEYIRTNKDEVLIVFDGFDEFGVEMSNGANEIVQILKGEKYKFGTVIVTTRPWKAHEIANNMSLRKQYAFVRIEGFKKKDVKTYVTKFYKDDTISAHSLLEFLEEGSLITETMAPFPIFCSMLCHMWKEVERREVIRKLQTFSQLFQEMIELLKQHYASKHCEAVYGDSVEIIGKTIDNHFKKISEIAFNGLLLKQLAFPEEKFVSCVEDLLVACEVGLLTKERTNCKRPHGTVRKLAKVESTVSFPHKLFQEYTAGLYLQELFHSNVEEFNQMKSRILKNPGEFKYLLYFLGAFDVEIAKYIVTKLMDRRECKLNFIVEVALECHSEQAANLIEAKHPEINRSLVIKKGTRRHVIAAYIFTFTHLISLSVETFCSSKALSRIIADTVCSLQTLKELKIVPCNHFDEFIQNMQERAEAVTVESLEICQTYRRQVILSESVLQKLGASICAMPCLKNVKLSVNLSDGIYNALREGASSLKVESLQIHASHISESASQNLGAIICAMNISQNMQIDLVKIEQMHLMGASCNSSHLSTIALLPTLKSLTLFDIKINDNRKHTEEEGSDPSDTHSSASLTELNVDEDSFLSLYGIGLLKRFPRIQKMTLAFHGRMTPFPRQLPHVTMPDVTDLSLHGNIGSDLTYLTMVSLEPFPNLINLSLINTNIGNADCTSILDSLRSKETLKTISIKNCDTDAGLDPLYNEINAEGKMTVNVEHGRFDNPEACPIIIQCKESSCTSIYYEQKFVKRKTGDYTLTIWKTYSTNYKRWTEQLYKEGRKITTIKKVSPFNVIPGK